MRRRHIATPRVEPMEGRVVLSNVSLLSPSASAHLHKFGDQVKTAATSVQQEIMHLIQSRHGHPSQAQWTAPHSHAKSNANTLFGIPWLKY